MKISLNVIVCSLIFLIIESNSCSNNSNYNWVGLPPKGSVIEKELFMTYTELYSNSKYYVVRVDLGPWGRDHDYDYRALVLDKQLRIIGTTNEVFLNGLSKDTLHLYSYVDGGKYVPIDLKDMPEDLYIIDDKRGKTPSQGVNYEITKCCYDTKKNVTVFSLTLDTISCSYELKMQSKYKDTLINVSNNELSISKDNQFDINLSTTSREESEISIGHLKWTKMEMIAYKEAMWFMINHNNYFQKDSVIVFK